MMNKRVEGGGWKQVKVRYVQKEGQSRLIIIIIIIIIIMIIELLIVYRSHAGQEIEICCCVR